MRAKADPARALNQVQLRWLTARLTNNGKIEEGDSYKASLRDPRTLEVAWSAGVDAFLTTPGRRFRVVGVNPRDESETVHDVAEICVHRDRVLLTAPQIERQRLEAWLLRRRAPRGRPRTYRQVARVTLSEPLPSSFSSNGSLDLYIAERRPRWRSDVEYRFCVSGLAGMWRAETVQKFVLELFDIRIARSTAQQYLARIAEDGTSNS